MQHLSGTLEGNNAFRNSPAMGIFLSPRLLWSCHFAFSFVSCLLVFKNSFVLITFRSIVYLAFPRGALSMADKNLFDPSFHFVGHSAGVALKRFEAPHSESGVRLI